MAKQANKPKITLITGGSRGLGKNMALQSAQKGMDVIITYHSQKAEAENVVNEIKALGQNAYALQLDVAKADSFDGFAENLKNVLQTKFNTTNWMPW